MFRTFDKIDTRNVTLIELDVQDGIAEWKGNDNLRRRYHIAHIKDTILVDLINITTKELTKSLLKDLNKIGEHTKSKIMYVSLKTSSPSINTIVRSMMVCGFEITSKEEAKKLLSSTDLIVMKLEVSSDLDLPDLT